MIERVDAQLRDSLRGRQHSSHRHQRISAAISFTVFLVKTVKPVCARFSVLRDRTTNRLPIAGAVPVPQDRRD